MNRLTKTGAAERFALAAKCAQAAHARGESMAKALHHAGFASTDRSAQQLIVQLRKKGHQIPNGFKKVKAPKPPPPPPVLQPITPRPVPTETLIGRRPHVLACTEDGCDAEFALERAVDLRHHTRIEHQRFPIREERMPVVKTV